MREVQASTIDQIRHCMCCRKLRYSNVRNAEFHRQEVADKFGGVVNAYYCVFCNHAHIGGAPKPSSLKITTDLGAMLRFDFSSPCPICGVTDFTSAHSSKRKPWPLPYGGSR